MTPSASSNSLCAFSTAPGWRRNFADTKLLIFRFEDLLLITNVRRSRSDDCRGAPSLCLPNRLEHGARPAVENIAVANQPRLTSRSNEFAIHRIT